MKTRNVDSESLLKPLNSVDTGINENTQKEFRWNPGIERNDRQPTMERHHIG
jgi:hypothetical protein